MPPQAGSPAPTQDPPQRGSHHALIRWVIGVLVLAIVILVVWFLVQPSFFQNLFHKEQSTPPPGTFVLDFPVAWQGPNNEQLYGLITYNPAPKAFSNLITPQAVYSPIVYKNVISPNGKLVFAIASDGKTVSLVTYSLQLQQVANTIDTAPMGTMFQDPIWSPDGSHIAYRTITLPTPNMHATSSPQVVYNPASTAYVANTDGSGNTKLGNSMVPAMFSPDNTKLLVVGGPYTFEMITLPQGTASTSQISIISKSQIQATGGGPMVFDPTGKRFAALDRTTGVNIYRVDWQNSQVLKIDVTKDFPGDALFGTDGELLTVNSKNQANVYYFYATGDGVRVNTYPFAVPDHALLINWSPNEK